MGGVGNLVFRCSEIQRALCDYHVFVDADDAAEESIKQALDEGVLDDRQYGMCSARGRPEAEFEDLVKKSIVKKLAADQFGVHSLSVDKGYRMKRWSERMKNALHKAGKRWDKRVAGRFKALIADQVVAGPDEALEPDLMGPIENLVEELESRMQQELV